MLRVNSAACLVVPPFECAWLQGADSLENGCCVSFEVRGENDVTIIFKSEATGRRWQHITRDGVGAVPAQQPAGRWAEPPGTERNYTVILGSHRNSCIKVEKNGELADRADNVPGTRLSSTEFLQFWVDYTAGRISVGTGAPGSNAAYSWSDPDPAPPIHHVALSAWDHHIAYRNIQILGPVSAAAEQALRAVPHSSPAAKQPPCAVPSLQDACMVSLQQQLSPSSACTVLALADLLRPSADALREAAVGCLASCLLKALACDTAGLQRLSFDCMLDLLSHPALGCEERVVFEAVAQWVAGQDHIQQGSGNQAAQRCLDQLLPLVRFPLMTDDELAALDHHPLMTGLPTASIPAPAGRCHREAAGDAAGDAASDASDVTMVDAGALDADACSRGVPAACSSATAGEAADCRRSSGSTVLADLLAEAKQRHALEEARHLASGPTSQAAPLEVADTRHVRLRTSAADAAAARRLQRRPAAHVKELMYVSDGDSNGVTHFLGCNGGCSAWVNPHTAARLTVRASSPACRFTDPKALVGQNFARMNFAGPRREASGGGVATWWSIDLGARHRLACNYYTIRADASRNFPSSWELQGSEEGETWATLRRHIDDTTIKLPGQMASWPVGGKAAARPYRHFRLLLHAASVRHTEFALSKFELYGYWHDDDSNN